MNLIMDPFERMLIAHYGRDDRFPELGVRCEQAALENAPEKGWPVLGFYGEHHELLGGGVVESYYFGPTEFVRLEIYPRTTDGHLLRPIRRVVYQRTADDGIVERVEFHTVTRLPTHGVLYRIAID
jgi:hypothetical protein